MPHMVVFHFYYKYMYNEYYWIVVIYLAVNVQSKAFIHRWLHKLLGST